MPSAYTGYCSCAAHCDSYSSRHKQHPLVGPVQKGLSKAREKAQQKRKEKAPCSIHLQVILKPLLLAHSLSSSTRTQSSCLTVRCQRLPLK